MKIPKRLQSHVDMGLVDEVLHPLMSGKEADLYVVRAAGERRCAKVYKEAMKRSFKKAVLYREGRKVRNSRRGRAMERGSRYGRTQQEETWQHAEVDALQQLAAAGVRVPVPYTCFDGVLLMELVQDADGDVAPRLGDVELSHEDALRHHATLLADVVRMLCAGVVHGDLSPFNVLLDPEGPVVIDLPQAVDAAANNQARWMLERDVDTVNAWFAKFAPELAGREYGQEIWEHYEAGTLHPGIELTGWVAPPEDDPDVDGVLSEIEAVKAEEAARLKALAPPDPEQAVDDGDSAQWSGKG